MKTNKQEECRIHITILMVFQEKIIAQHMLLVVLGKLLEVNTCKRNQQNSNLEEQQSIGSDS